MSATAPARLRLATLLALLGVAVRLLLPLAHGGSSCHHASGHLSSGHHAAGMHAATVCSCGHVHCEPAEGSDRSCDEAPADDHICLACQLEDSTPVDVALAPMRAAPPPVGFAPHATTPRDVRAPPIPGRPPVRGPPRAGRTT